MAVVSLDASDKTPIYAQLERGLSRRTQNDQLLVGALINYERGVCSQGEFDRAETTRERVRTGSAAITELQSFIEKP